MEIIQNDKTIKVVNLEILPRGMNAKYLECIRGEGGVLVAKQWRRSVPKNFSVLIEFKKSNGGL